MLAGSDTVARVPLSYTGSRGRDVGRGWQRDVDKQHPRVTTGGIKSVLREHEIQLRVRYQDADPMGLLHHSHFFTYFEIGRTELLRASGGNYRRMEEEGMFAVVVKAECVYHKPAHYDDLLTIRTIIRRITPAKIEHEYHVLRDQERLATGHVSMALVDRNGVVQKIPEWLQESVRTTAPD